MNAVVQAEPAESRAVTPMQMLQIAVQQGADLEKLEKLMDLQERWEAAEARKAFIRAMAAFKADPPTILKSKHVNIPGGAKFAHATLAEVVDAICASLSKYGLSHRWETHQDGAITVTCVITHERGHSERTTLTAAPDDSGKKNSIQQIASTVTYLQRYTLLAATGLAAKDIDDDGRASGQAVERISEQQAADLKALATEVGANIERFLKYMGVESFADLPASEYSRAVKELEKKRRKQ